MFKKEIICVKNIIPVLIKKILEIYNTDFNVELKSDNSPITIADKLANKIIIEHLSENFSSHYFLSEESKDNLERLNKEFVWVIDPIDGTKEFVKKNGEFAINIALLQNNKPVLGFVVVPIKNIYYYAVAGDKAFKVDLDNNSETEIFVSKNNYMKNSTITISRSHATEIEEFFIKENNIKNVLKKGSAYKVCIVADGSADFYVRSVPLSEWDICAPLVIIEAAGGKITDFNNNELRFNKKEVTFSNGIICSNNILHNEIFDCIKKFDLNK
jgi:3'(2'), 5'-bisphosphate nucleotidase